MAVKLIALDLDGTALQEHRFFAERTRRAVLEALEAGILVVPSTGRSYRDIPEEVRELPGIPYFLTSNGANILDGRTEQTVYSDLIPREAAIKALRLLEAYEVQPSVHVDGVSINLKTADPRVVARYGSTDYFTRRSVENLADYMAGQSGGAEKIFAILFRPEFKDELAEKVTELYSFTVTASGRDNIELNSTTADKGHGLSMLCARLGISAGETAVIGDSINDSSMFRFAGCRIAMGNAEPSIKMLSEHVTGTCEELGAASALEKLTRREW